MKAVILAGGKGTRLIEKTKMIPKPMIKIGSKPIIWHIIKLLSYQGVNEFIICSGYKRKIIENFFENHSNVKVVNTGLNSKTAKRIGFIEKYIEKNEDFLMTYGDGLSNINLNRLLQFHLLKKKLATVTAVVPPPRFGSLIIKNGMAVSFNEKIKDYNNLINGGFFILNQKIFKILDLKKNQMWEQDPLERLSSKRQLAAYLHRDFWHPMDTLRDNLYLNELWKSNKAPWKIW